MATTFEPFVAALDQLNVRHFPDPANDATLLPYRTPTGDLLVVARVECNGEYIGFHTQMPMECPDDARVTRLIAEQNHCVRVVQVSAKDRRVSASAGLWIMDGRLTPKMLQRYLDNFVGVAARAFGEIRDAIAGTGPYSTSLVHTAGASN